MDGELKKSQKSKGSSSSLVAGQTIALSSSSKNSGKVKSLSEQDKDRKKSIDEIDEFFAPGNPLFRS